MNISHSLLAAAVSGIIVGATGCSSGKAASSEPAMQNAAMSASAGEKHGCKGQNACKGQGGCQTDTHGCKGQNACKGQGGCQSDKHSCENKNSCKGQGGCS